LRHKSLQLDNHIFLNHFLCPMRLTRTIFISLLALDTSVQRQLTAKNWYDKGLALYNHGKYDKAIKAFEKSIKLNPKDAKVWYNKGEVLKALGNVTESKAAFAKAKEMEDRG